MTAVLQAELVLRMNVEGISSAMAQWLTAELSVAQLKKQAKRFDASALACELLVRAASILTGVVADPALPELCARSCP